MSNTKRIPSIPEALLGPREVVEAIRKRRGGSLLNLDRMLLNSPAFAVGWNGFLGAVRNSLSLDARLRELAICAVAVLNRADYELLQHAPEWLAAGGTQAQLDGLQDYDAAMQDVTLFSEAERAVLQLTLEATRMVKSATPALHACNRFLARNRPKWNWLVSSPPTTWCRAFWKRFRYKRNRGGGDA